MRRISFALTPRQLLDGSKTVTRRMGWVYLVERVRRAPENLLAVSKCMGLKKGERPTIYGPIKVSDARREPLSIIDQEDVIREGFPDMNPAQFVEFFCDSHRGCEPQTEITRIAFDQAGNWDTEQTEAEFIAAGHSLDWLHHGGSDDERVCCSHNAEGKRYVFRCSRCLHWCCDCAGGSDQLCSPCWCAVDANFGLAFVKPRRLPAPKTPDASLPTSPASASPIPPRRVAQTDPRLMRGESIPGAQVVLSLAPAAPTIHPQPADFCESYQKRAGAFLTGGE